MIEFILKAIFQHNKMKDSTLDLFSEQEDKRNSDEFSLNVEYLAEKYKVTSDYIIQEFILD